MTIRSGDPAGIKATGLTKSYGVIEAVRGIDFTIAPGETVAILGPNGAGKSTTLDMVLGLTRPDRGTISLFNVPPASAVEAGWVGSMLQTGSLPDYLRVRELITLLASLYPHPLRVDEVLDLTGIANISGRWTTKLSGGQVQRVRFAAALIGNPDLLVLDEPTSGVDVEGRREFWGAARAIAERGKTIVFATHYLEEADAFADRIVLMARGRIVVDGATTEVKAKVGAGTIRATLPGADLDSLRTLPGVSTVERHGDTVRLTSSDPDVSLQALLRRFQGVQDLEIQRASLEETFFALTANEDATEVRSDNAKSFSLSPKEVGT